MDCPPASLASKVDTGGSSHGPGMIEEVPSAKPGVPHGVWVHLFFISSIVGGVKDFTSNPEFI